MARNQINYSSRKEKSSWDANRLIREYVGIAWMLNFSEQLEDLSWDHQVRVRRVASAVCAFLSKDADAIKRLCHISHPSRCKQQRCCNEALTFMSWGFAMSCFICNLVANTRSKCPQSYMQSHTAITCCFSR